MNCRYTCVDLFCGAGGLSRGFLDAGYDVVLGVDNDDAALETYQSNNGPAAAMNLDLYDHSNLDKIVDFLKEKQISSLDVLMGGPPCQGYSYAGKMDINDKRNFLYLAMVKLTERLRPKAVLLENVLAMAEANDGVGAKRVIDDFSAIGYKMTKKVLFAPDFGIPQVRRRVFFVGLRDTDKEFIFPGPSVSEDHYISCEEAISDLPSLQTEDGEIIRGGDIQAYMSAPTSAYQEKMRGSSAFVFNHIGSIPIEKTRKMISLIPEGKNYLALPEIYRKQYKYHEALTRYHSKKPSLTINTGHRTHFHYKWNRIPTVRENARLQSFPDDFIFYGSLSEQFKQVGNAVPPLLGQALAAQLSRYISEINEEQADAI